MGRLRKVLRVARGVLDVVDDWQQAGEEDRARVECAPPGGPVGRQERALPVVRVVAADFDPPQEKRASRVIGRGYAFRGLDYDEAPEGYGSTKVAGVSHRQGALQNAAFDPLRPVSLIPEFDNRYDENAIGVWDAAGRLQIGYLPKEVAVRWAPFVRDGYPLAGCVLYEWRQRRSNERCGVRLLFAAHAFRVEVTGF
jgi:hypothetical protein